MAKLIDYSKDVEDLEQRVSSLESLIWALKHKIHELEHQNRSSILRLNNQEELSLDFITKNSRYQDLSPEKAFEFYNNKDRNFILLDVSSKDFCPIADLPEVMNIPIEHLAESLSEIPNKAASILIISEDGIKSILACEYLFKAGYCNLNNISGGYKYWLGHNNLRSINQSRSQSA